MHIKFFTFSFFLWTYWKIKKNFIKTFKINRTLDDVDRGAINSQHHVPPPLYGASQGGGSSNPPSSPSPRVTSTTGRPQSAGGGKRRKNAAVSSDDDCDPVTKVWLFIASYHRQLSAVIKISFLAPTGWRLKLILILMVVENYLYLIFQYGREPFLI